MNFSRQSFLITGGTGSFGHAIVRHLLSQNEHTSASRVAVLSRDEFKQHEMRQLFGDDSRLRFFLGDVRDLSRLTRAFHGVDVVVHAAAMKQVPAAEYNPTECVHTNVFGAENVISAALDCGVHKVVALSTDKACQPATLYGSSKLVAERIFVAANSLGGQSGTRFSCTRYGNVEGSRGSVIPIWLDAYKRKRPLLVTDPESTRFHMRQTQAVQLVLLALREMDGGEVFIPKLPSYRLADLADAIAGPAYPRTIIGLRPNEKKHESLISVDEARTARDCGDHYRIMPAVHSWRSDSALPGEALLDGFTYRSDIAPMTPEQVREVLAQEKAA